MMYIDLHTHSLRLSDPRCLVFRSFHQMEQQEFAGYAGECSVGLHPWWLDPEAMEPQWNWLEGALSEPRVRMLGEIGLDRLRGPALDFQQKCFETQLDWGHRLEKPVLVHCVRAFSELRSSVKRRTPRNALILHGYHRSPELLRELMPLGFGFSFGAAILKENHPAVRSIREVPRDFLWLETDDSGIGIEDIYARAADILGCTIVYLQELIYNNCHRIGLV